MNLKIIKPIIATLAIFLSASSLLAQDNIWNLTLTNGETITGVTLQPLGTDSLVISNMQLTKLISVDSIFELRKVKKSNLWKGAGIGFLAGAVVGALLGLMSYQNPDPKGALALFGPGESAFIGALFCAPIGFVTGAIIGNISGKDKIYNLSEMSHDQKLETIQMLLAKQESDKK